MPEVDARRLPFAGTRPLKVSLYAGGADGRARSGLTCFMASSYVGGGRSHLPVNVVPKNEKNRDDDRKEPVGLATPRSSANEDLTDHWISALAKQDKHRSSVMASKM